MRRKLPVALVLIGMAINIGIAIYEYRQTHVC